MSKGLLVFLALAAACVVFVLRLLGVDVDADLGFALAFGGLALGAAPVA